jgi:ubiquitin carboxyl-terminal hydrolase 34
LLSKDYGANLQEMSNHLMYAFVEADGPKNLFDLTVGACDKTSIIMHNYIAIWAPQLLDSVGWYIYAAHNLPPGANEEQTHRNTLEFFRRYNYFLQDPSKVADAVQTKDIINYFSNLLFDLCQWHPIIADELLEEMLNFRDPESPTTADQPQTSRDFQDPNLFPTLVRHAWKFKLLRKYVVKGRMEVRVMSIGTMDTALVDIWKEYNEHTLSTNHPIMQYIADFLLHERVVDYIISVDSHPQLISRSGNIVGFLVVTGRYSERQTDAIWNTASKSSDPRVVSATMSMLRNITNLMQPPEILYLVTKLHDVAIESCTVEMVRFMRDIVPKLHHVNWSTTDVKARPWNVFIRLMQETSPTKETNKLSMALHMEAAEQLRVVSSHVRTDERHELYRQCANHIASRSPQATGSVHAIYLLVAATDSKDIIFFEVNSDVTRLIIEETCAFIGKESMGIVFNTPQACAIQYRLDLLSFLISRAANAIPSDLHEPIWDHLVGKYAQTIQLRDLAWSKLLEATKGRSDNGFCKQLISVYVPNLEPEYYTIGMFDFVAAYRFPTTRRVVETSEGQKLLLQIRGADLLWSMIRSAPPGTIEERTATLLASRYLELDPVHGITLQEMEQAHVALVEECTQEILSCYKEIRDEETRNSDKMDVVLTDPVNEQKERRFTRTVLFLKMLLMSIRTKAEFNRSQRSDSKVESLGDEELPDGDVVELKYQITSGHNTIVVGLENTLHDVYLRLCRATGFSKINMFAMGKKLNLAEDGSRKVASLDLARQLILVQKASGGEVSLPVADIGGHCSVFETAILNRFEELFACMDAGDSLSATVSASSF